MTFEIVFGILTTVLGFFLVRLVNKLDKAFDKIIELSTDLSLLKQEMLRVLDVFERQTKVEHEMVLVKSMTKAYFKQVDELKSKIHEL